MKLFLFDMDGTLAKSTCPVEPKMLETLERLKESDPDIHVGIVSGGTYEKLMTQICSKSMLPDGRICSKSICPSGPSARHNLADYVFSENGTVTYVRGHLVHRGNIIDVMGEQLLQAIINYVLRYIAQAELPYKRGSFVRFRNGMLYITPIGGDCNAKERAAFAKYDEIHEVRRKMIRDLLQEFGRDKIDVKMGGQIGIGLHPPGWDKSYMLKFVDFSKYDRNSFFRGSL
jgi:phosphomannomutase